MNLYYWLRKKAEHDPSWFWFHIWAAWAFCLTGLKHYRRGNPKQGWVQIKEVGKNLEEAWYSVPYM